MSRNVNNTEKLSFGVRGPFVKFEKMKATNMVVKKLESRQALVGAASLEQIKIGKMYDYVLAKVTCSIRGALGRCKGAFL